MVSMDVNNGLDFSFLIGAIGLCMPKGPLVRTAVVALMPRETAVPLIS